MTLQTTVHHGATALHDLRPAWDALVARTPTARPHVTHGWVTAECRRLGAHDTVRVITAHDGATLVGAVPLLRTPHPLVTAHGTIANDHPSYTGVLADPQAPAITDALARAVADAPGDLLVAENVSEADAATRQWLAALTDHGFHVHRVHRAPCWWMTLEPTLDDYLPRVQSGKTRKKTRQYERNLHRAGLVEIERHHGAALTDDVLARLRDIQTASWLQRRGAAVFSNSSWRRFVGDLGAADLARVWIMTLDGQDVAFAIATTTARHMIYEWIAFRLDHQHLRVGKLLTKVVLEDACAAGIETFDFSHGDGEYKAFWGEATHTVERIVAGRGLAGLTAARALAEAWRLGRSPVIRRTVRRLRHVAGGGRRAA